jgi:sulfotransferase family protein
MPDYRPVIILGAARSGTNLLRNTLCKMPGYQTWPCDELPTMWRHSNLAYPHDEFPVELARPEVRKFMRQAFDRFARRSGAANVIEKTCANTLRVAFLDAIFPDAVYLHLVRDGRDVTASAMQRWTSTVDLSYTLKKVKFVPWTDLPYYAARFLKNRLLQGKNKDGRMHVWGPRFEGMEQCVDLPLAELCARQWQRSVERSRHDLAQIDSSRWVELDYEDLVSKPAAVLETLGEFFGESWSASSIAQVVDGVQASSVGNWQRNLSPEDCQILHDRLGFDTLSPKTAASDS